MKDVSNGMMKKIGIKLPEAPISISKSDQKGTSFVDADYFL